MLRIPHDDLKFFPHEIRILQRQTDQNKAERKTFCEDISQRIQNDPGLLDLNYLNNVDHRGLCGASATLPASRNLATKVELSFYQVHCSCQNLSRIAAVSKELILW